MRGSSDRKTRKLDQQANELAQEVRQAIKAGDTEKAQELKDKVESVADSAERTRSPKEPGGEVIRGRGKMEELARKQEQEQRKEWQEATDQLDKEADEEARKARDVIRTGDLTKAEVQQARVEMLAELAELTRDQEEPGGVVIRGRWQGEQTGRTEAEEQKKDQLKKEEAEKLVRRDSTHARDEETNEGAKRVRDAIRKRDPEMAELLKKRVEMEVLFAEMQRDPEEKGGEVIQLRRNEEQE